MVTVLEARGVTKEFRGGDGALLRVLDDVSLEVRRGEMVAVVGASGAGKGTGRTVPGAAGRRARGGGGRGGGVGAGGAGKRPRRPGLGALDRPTRGEVFVGGEALAGRSDDALAA